MRAFARERIPTVPCCLLTRHVCAAHGTDGSLEADRFALWELRGKHIFRDCSDTLSVNQAGMLPCCCSPLPRPSAAFSCAGLRPRAPIQLGAKDGALSPGTQLASLVALRAQDAEVAFAIGCAPSLA